MRLESSVGGKMQESEKNVDHRVAEILSLIDDILNHRDNAYIDVEVWNQTSGEYFKMFEVIKNRLQTIQSTVQKNGEVTDSLQKKLYDAFNAFNFATDGDHNAQFEVLYQTGLTKLNEILTELGINPQGDLPMN